MLRAAIIVLAGLGALARAPAAAEALPEAGEIVLPPAPVAGADDPVYRAAAVRWLHGQDERALPILAELANADNLAAQLLLGAIEASGLSESPWVAGLERAERLAIFRRMDTRFGTSWLAVAGERTRLAELLGPPSPDANGDYTADAALELAALGEARLAHRHFAILLNIGLWDEVLRLEELAREIGMEPHVWAAASHAGGPGRLVEEGIAAFRAGGLDGWLFATLANREDQRLDALLAPSDALRRYLAVPSPPVEGLDPPPPGGDAVLDALLAEAAEIAPLRRYCAIRCPGEERRCTRDLYRMMQGLTALPDATGSPIETLIPEEVFARSRRAEMALEMYAANAVRAAADPAAALARMEIPACLSAAMERWAHPR